MRGRGQGEDERGQEEVREQRKRRARDGKDDAGGGGEGKEDDAGGSERLDLMRIEILPLGHVHLLGSIEPAGQGVRLPRLQRQAELKLLVVDQSD
eukprot:764953-Hanusia_phi.AAC.3